MADTNPSEVKNGQSTSEKRVTDVAIYGGLFLQVLAGALGTIFPDHWVVPVVMASAAALNQIAHGTKYISARTDVKIAQINAQQK